MKRNIKNKSIKFAPQASEFRLPQTAFTKILSFVEQNVAFCALIIGFSFQIGFLLTNYFMVGVNQLSIKLVIPLCVGTLAGYFFCKIVIMGVKGIKDIAINEITSGMESNEKIQKVSVEGFSRISDARDKKTGRHIQRIGYYAELVTLQLAKSEKYKSYITPRYVKDINMAASLHDIGKVGVTDKILNKAGILTFDEFEVMKMHAIIGGDLMADLERKLPYTTFYTLGKEIAYHHHQKWDGTGYPNVLKIGDSHAFFVQDGVGEPLSGEEIPLCARIVAVVDVYDALVSKRIYKDAFSHEKARDIIVKDSGSHFDPDVVEAFLAVEDDVYSYSQKNKD